MLRLFGQKCGALLLLRLTNRYHLPSLLQSKHEQDHVIINPNLFHLYLAKLMNSAFDQRFTVLIFLDCYRTSQPVQRFNQIVSYALNNLQYFTSRVSLVIILSQMHHYRSKDKHAVISIAQKAFSIIQLEDSGESFYNLKLLIAIDSLVGLQTFPESAYRMINFKKFRPLTLAMALELFYGRGLQKKYKLVDEIVDMFVACQLFIPFADVHHLSYAIRKIDNAKFKECFFRIRKRIQSSLTMPKFSNVRTDSQDCRSQVNKVQQIWTKEQEYLQRFRDQIINKYRY